MASVPQRFADIVKRHSRCPKAGGFDADASMASLGLGSLAILNLLVSIEDEYGIRFPEQLVRPDVFATPAKLWRGLQSYLIEENR